MFSMNLQKNILFCLLLLLVSCGPNSLEEYRERGEGVTRSLIKEMEGIHSYEDLLAAQAELTRLFKEFAELMVAAKKFQKQGELELTEVNHRLSDCLREEMNRIYRFEGGREMIELYQRDGLSLL